MSELEHVSRWPERVRLQANGPVHAVGLEIGGHWDETACRIDLLGHRTGTYVSDATPVNCDGCLKATERCGL